MIDLAPSISRRGNIASEQVLAPSHGFSGTRRLLLASVASLTGAVFLDSPKPSHAQSAAEVRFAQHDAIFQRVKFNFQKWRPADINHPDSARAFNPDKPIWVKGGAYALADEVHYRLTGQIGQARQYEEWMAKRLLYQHSGAKGYTGKCFAYNNYLHHILNGREDLPWRDATDSLLGVSVGVEYQKLVDLEAVGQHGADASIKKSLSADENINLFCTNTQQTGEEFIVMTNDPPGFTGLWFALIRRFVNGYYSSVIAGKEITISRNHMKGYAYQPRYLATRADAAKIAAALEPEEQRSPFLDHDEIRLITRGVELPPGWNIRYPLFWDDNVEEYAQYMTKVINSEGRDNRYGVSMDFLEVPQRPQD